jgi:perosamine synthetase
MQPIPVNQPLLGDLEKQYLNECIETGWISAEGPFVKRLEAGLADRLGRKHGVAVCNGTAALEVAIAALKLGAGDEVILPTLTIISCAAAIVRAGATPVLVDADPLTWNMDVSQIEAKITPRTRAIMVVHLYGLPVEMEPVLALAEKYGLFVIEDAAELLGQTYQSRPCGSFGTISTFSFYSNKHITTGEGGMVLTDDDAIADRCRSLRNLCFQPQKRFIHEELGWNYRLSNLQAAVGVAQLEQLDRFLERKRQIGRLYTELLTDIPGLQLPLAKTEYAENIYWVYGLVLEDSLPLDATETMKRLAQHQIGTRPFFWGMHEQPVFQAMNLFQQERYSIAERLARRGFYVPSGIALTDPEIYRVAEVLHEVLR